VGRGIVVIGSAAVTSVYNVKQHNFTHTRILPGIRFRNDVVDDHENHCTRGKRQGVRQQWLDERNGEYANESGDRLHHATKLSVPVEKINYVCT